MSNLLLNIWGHPLYNGTIFPPRLYVYDDILLYKKRHWYYFVTEETTLSYSHIVQVNLTKGLFFAKLEIINTGVKNITLNYVYKGNAEKAKKIIDQKIFFSLAKEKPREDPQFANQLHSYEMSINRLKELLAKGKISEGEFNAKKKELLKKIH